MYFRTLFPTVALLASVLLTGCSSHIVVPAAYAPDLGAARSDLDGSVMIREVIDRRRLPGDMYFHDKDGLMHGRFDRPVSGIIKEALVYEFERAGLGIVSSSMPEDAHTRVLQCEIERFETTCGLGSDKVPVLNTFVTLAFMWSDPETGTVVEVRRHSEEATTIRSWNPVFGKKELNMFSGEDKTDLRAQSLKLVNELLPRVIQAELRENAHLRKTAEAEPSVEDRREAAGPDPSESETADAEETVSTARQADDVDSDATAMATEGLKSADDAAKRPDAAPGVVTDSAPAATESVPPAAKPESTTVVSPAAPAATPAPFAIRAAEFEADYKGECNTDATINSVQGDALGAGGQISIRNGALTLWGYGAKHTWKGRLTYGKHIFDSDEDNPLQFMVDKDKGYVYVGGQGSVTLPDGRVVTLPLDQAKASVGVSVEAAPGEGATAEAAGDPDRVDTQESEEKRAEPSRQESGQTEKPQLPSETIGTLRLIMQKKTDLRTTTFKDGVMTASTDRFEYEPDADITARLEQAGFEVIGADSDRAEDATLVVDYEEKKRGRGIDSPTAYYFSFRLNHKTKGTVLERGAKAAGCDSVDELKSAPPFRDIGTIVKTVFAREIRGHKAAAPGAVRAEPSLGETAASSAAGATKGETRIPFSKGDVVNIESISAIVGEGEASFSNSEKPGMLSAGVDGTTPVVDGMSCLFCVKTVTIGPNTKVPLSFFTERSEKGRHGGRIAQSISVSDIRLTGPGVSDDAAEYILSGEEGATLQKEGHGFTLLAGEAYYVRKVDPAAGGAEQKADERTPEGPRSSDTLLPAFSLSLAGHNEVRVKNPNDFDVTVGLRSGDGGRDFHVGANGVASVSVPDGRYQIYFIYSNEPDALFKGDDFSLSNNGVEIQIVKVVGGNYGIKRVK